MELNHWGKTIEFNAIALRNTTLPIEDRAELVNFQKKAGELARTFRGTRVFLDELIKKVTSLKQSALLVPGAGFELMVSADKILDQLDQLLLKFERRSNFPSTEENPPSQVTLSERLNTLLYTHWRSTSKLTKNELTAYNVLLEEFPPVYNEIKRISETDVVQLESALEKLGGHVIPGRLPELKIR
jgi:hypothetical protein